MKGIFGKDNAGLVSGRVGVIECAVNNDTGELVCELSSTDQPTRKFLVTASPDVDNNVKMTRIKSSDGQPIPSDLLNEIKAVVTDLVLGKIPLEEL